MHPQPHLHGDVIALTGYGGGPVQAGAWGLFVACVGVGGGGWDDACSHVKISGPAWHTVAPLFTKQQLFRNTQMQATPTFFAMWQSSLPPCYAGGMHL